MPRNEDGEFELILGNKQLLSVFFIVVTLLAVFFAMGFIMGRSVNPVAEARKVDNGPSDKPIVVDAKPSPSTSGTTTASVRPVEIKPPIETEVKTAPPKEDPKPEPKTKAQEPVKKTSEPETKKTEAKKAEPKKPEPKKPEPAPASGGKPGSGTYLQVAAVGQAEAELVSDLLAKKGFRTTFIPVDGKPDLRRVLVGPVKAGAEQSKAMDDLKAAGFKPFPRKL